MKGIMMNLQFSGGAKYLLGCGQMFITFSKLIPACTCCTGLRVVDLFKPYVLLVKIKYTKLS